METQTAPDWIEEVVAAGMMHMRSARLDFRPPVGMEQDANARVWELMIRDMELDESHAVWILKTFGWLAVNRHKWPFPVNFKARWADTVDEREPKTLPPVRGPKARYVPLPPNSPEPERTPEQIEGSKQGRARYRAAIEKIQAESKAGKRPPLADAFNAIADQAEKE